MSALRNTLRQVGKGAWLVLGLTALAQLGTCGLLDPDAGFHFSGRLWASLAASYIVTIAFFFWPVYRVVRYGTSRFLRIGCFVVTVPVYPLAVMVVPGFMLLPEQARLERFVGVCTAGPLSECAEAHAPPGWEHGVDAKTAARVRWGLWSARTPGSLNAMATRNYRQSLARFELAEKAGDYSIARFHGANLRDLVNVHQSGDLAVRIQLNVLRAEHDDHARANAAAKELCSGLARSEKTALEQSVTRGLASLSPRKPPPADLLTPLFQLYECEPGAPLVRQALFQLGVAPK